MERQLQAPSLQFGQLVGGSESSFKCLNTPMETKLKVKTEMNKLNIQTRRLGQAAAVGALVLASQAHAAPVDVTAVTTDIAAQAAPIAAIGAAVLVLIVGIKAFKWVRAAMS
jgi:hypothetical protein